MTMWHYAHLGGILQRGPGLTIIEATAVSPEGRITPEDLGLWKDSQTKALAKIVEFAHSQDQKIGVQLSHAGRKASTVAPWVNRKAAATEEVHGWPDRVMSVTNQPFSNDTCVPHEMTSADIEQFKADWVAALGRAIEAGVDCIEIHAAHGYLLHSFTSPAANERTDKYGGSFENRIRLLLEIVDLSKAIMPNDMPLLARITGTDWLEYDEGLPQWDLPQAVRLAQVLEKQGVDILDVSTGGVSDKQKIEAGPGYQVPCSLAIKKALPNSKMIIAVVGMITSGLQAQKILDDGAADMVTVGRAFLKDPGLVWHWAEELNINIYLANQSKCPVLHGSEGDTPAAQRHNYWRFLHRVFQRVPLLNNC